MHLPNQHDGKNGEFGELIPGIHWYLGEILEFRKGKKKDKKNYGKVYKLHGKKIFISSPINQHGYMKEFYCWIPRTLKFI